MNTGYLSDSCQDNVISYSGIDKRSKGNRSLIITITGHLYLGLCLQTGQISLFSFLSDELPCTGGVRTSSTYTYYVTSIVNTYTSVYLETQ